MKTYFDTYKEIKDKAVVMDGFSWKNKSREEREQILSEKTVITLDRTLPGCKIYWVEGNVNQLSNLECAIIADHGNLCFGYEKSGDKITVYTD